MNVSDEYVNWEWFKDLVKILRKQQKELMREQGGCNQVMLSVDLVAHDLRDWVSINPHSINLHTGKARLVNVNGVYREVDVKYLFQMQRLEPPDEEVEP